MPMLISYLVVCFVYNIHIGSHITFLCTIPFTQKKNSRHLNIKSQIKLMNKHLYFLKQHKTVKKDENTISISN